MGREGDLPSSDRLKNDTPEPVERSDNERPAPELSGTEADHGDSPDHPTQLKPSLRDMFSPDGDPLDVEHVLPQLRQAIEGEYSGLRVVIEDVSNGWGLRVETGIYDTNGNRVGYANRTYHYNEGNLTAEHNTFRLQDDFRGRGFATEFNERMFDWYAQSGGADVRLVASSSVGCYAWASAGFEFGSEPGACQHIRPNLDREIRRMRDELGHLERELADSPDDERRGKLKELRDMIVKADEIYARFKVGSDNFPTPREILEIGKPDGLLPGQSRHLTWPGKRVFTEPEGKVSWQGVKTIKEQ